jgi:Na+/proline symporter
MTLIDWTLIAFYLILSSVVGLYFTKRAQTGLNEYFLSGRSLPWWLAGTSMVATSFSCDTPLYVTKLVRTGGIWQNWQWWSFLIGGMMSAFLLSKLWRRAEIVTDVELAELRYSGIEAKILRGFRACYLAIPINCIAMGWVLLAMAKINNAILGWGKLESLILYCAITFIYSFLAGLWGVILTDFLQYIIAQAGAIVLAVYAVETAGGWQAIVDFISAQPEVYPDTLKFVPSAHSSASMEALSAAFIGFLTYIFVQWYANLNSDGGGKVVQRLNACKNENHAMGAFLWYNFSNFVIRSWPWIIAAIASIKLYPLLSDPEMAYPKMIVEILPSGVRGFVVMSLAAAFMSTICTQLNWGSSYLINDFYKRFIRKNRSEKHYLRSAQFATFLMMFFACLCAYFTESVTEAFKFIIAFGAGTGPVYILRWFWWRINAWSEISAMLASSAITIYLYSVTAIDYPVKILLIAGGSAVVWLIVTFLTPPVKDETLETFYRKIRPSGAWKPLKLKTGIAPEPLKAGIANWLIGVAVITLFIFGIGEILFGRVISGYGSVILAMGGTGWLYFRVRK